MMPLLIFSSIVIVIRIKMFSSGKVTIFFQDYRGDGEAFPGCTRRVPEVAPGAGKLLPSRGKNEITGMAKILVIDDERSIRNSMKEILEFEGHEVVLAENGMEGLVAVKTGHPDVVFCDIKMPKMEGVEVLERIKGFSASTPVIMISGHGTIDTAIESIRKGAYDFIEKPLDLNRLLITIKNATDRHELILETQSLKSKVSKKYEMIGNSPAMQRVRLLIEKVAGSDARILVTGPNGSGKELVARQLHELGPRKERGFVEVNCAAIPSELIESELFGHEKGSFTSAIRQKKGKFELAHGGTLFLDEVGDMSLGAQAKVLRALQEQKITRVGGDVDIRVDARVIAATNKNLKEEIARGCFREDLYHRLSVIIIEVPPLANRVEDIEPLVKHFLTTICEEMGVAARGITEEAVRTLEKGEWTGNIRELRNVVERLIILGGNPISEEDVCTYR
jgi:DNA-binding NtrC family response regulator